ncbi:murein biosynthesis integral membrane protein MurJ [Chthonobacter rhizosphaerae]|uniref:murein biosynthesis integral membrane protein MurJ n=1 Tax=Chthonobacter rhizosphaerae TaxID=2735553 RepID=UPI0015EE7AA8|nr:murein biosynthesis integral membrane protein MurJ [Chthonobacter rhizosphaerae]
MSLLKNFATVGMATMTSRVLGFVRDMFMASMLGAGPIADTFFVAFRLPNLFRRLFAEGAFSAAFVPLFSRALAEDGQPGARRLAEEILAVFLLALVVVTAAAELAAPLLVYLLAPGFAADPEKFSDAELMTRIMFPYLACMSLTAMAAGMLQSFGRFAVAAFAPSLLNVVLVAVLGLIWWQGWAGTQTAAYALSWAVFAAGFAQLLAVAGSLWFIGFPVSLRRPRVTPNVRRLVTLGIPGVISGGITQINIVIGTAIASFIPNAVSWLNYADRIYQLPLGVIGVAIGVVLLPDLTRRLRSGDAESAFPTQNRALEFAMALTLPATVALIAIPDTIMRVLFERGAFTPEDTAATALAVAAFAAGLPAFVAIKVFQPSYFAREDTRTPTIQGGWSVAVNVAGSLALVPFVGHVGIAIATSLAAWVNAVLLLATLVRRGHFVGDRLLTRRLLLLTGASLAMGGALLAGKRTLAPFLDSPSELTAGLALLALCAGGMGVYGLATVLTGAVDVKRYGRAVLARRAAKGAPTKPGADA